MLRNSSRTGSSSRLGLPERNTLSPQPFGQEVPRRHSSCTPEVQKLSRTSNDFLEVPNVDERRWSVGDARDANNYLVSFMGKIESSKAFDMCW